MSSPRRWWQTPLVMLAAGTVVLVLLADVLLGRARGAPPDLVLFVGRFHPLVVHLPIGIFILVALGEAATLRPQLRERIDPVTALVLPVLVVSAVGAFLLGHLLARSGDFPSHALALHRRLALAGVVGGALCLAAWVYQREQNPRGGRVVYRALLAASLTLLSLGGHFGGTMTRGETYLAKYAPEVLKPLLGGGSAPAASVGSAAPLPARAEPLLFADVVLPVLQDHCVECHGSEKAKGGLRLDSLEHLQKGGENGAAIVPSAAGQSLLVRRMHLPAGDDERMPPEDKPAPDAGEIALIEFWIDRGASASLRVGDALAPPQSRALLERALNRRPPAPRPPTSAAPSPPPSSSATPPQAVHPEPEAQPRAASEPPGAGAPTVTPPAVAPPAGNARAILADKCQSCHGENKRKGKLRVDSIEALLAGGSEGPAVVPGRPEQSLILKRARLPIGNDEHMPPEAEPQLTPAELAVLTRWVREMKGAPAPSGPSESVILAKASVAERDPAPEAPVRAEAPAAAEAPAPDDLQDPVPAAENSQPPRAARPLVSFRQVIQPMLVKKCSSCHGVERSFAKLDVTSHARLLASSSSGPSVVPGQPLASELLRRVTLPLSSDEHMPPAGEPQLEAQEVEWLRDWIAQGARDEARAENGSLDDGASASGAARSEPGKVQARGGCAACMVGAPSATPFDAGAVSLSSALVALLALRRRRGRASTRSLPNIPTRDGARTP